MPTEEFRNQLLNTQETSPALREAYRKELDAMLQPPMTAKSALPGIALLIMLLVCTGLIARAILFHPVGGMLLGMYIILAAASLAASAFLIRDLLKRKHSQHSASSVAGLLTAAAGTMTVLVLLVGLRNASDPKSLFGAFYVFIFYFSCAIWGLHARIAAAELGAREQSLRIEYRLADLAERLEK